MAAIVPIRPVPWFLIPYLERVEDETLNAYRDSTGHWTIGVGHTGPEVVAGLAWTQQQIDAALTVDLHTAQLRLVAAIGQPCIDLLSDCEYAALLSFVFNAGEVSTWTIWGDIRSGDLAGVPKELARFVYSNGVKIKGLVNRRAADIALWNGTDPVLKLSPPPVVAA